MWLTILNIIGQKGKGITGRSWEFLKRALLLSAGPLHVGEEATESNRKEDRSVEVWAYWTPKESEQAGVTAEPAG